MGIILDIKNDELGFAEKAAISGAPGAGRGVFWVKNDSPSTPYFTDDTGADFNLAGGGGSPGGSTTQIQYNNAGAFGGDTGFTTDGAGSVNITGDLDVDNININGNTISSTNANGVIVISNNGTGAIQVDTGGNTRGTNAVDFQRIRDVATQVASGAYSFIAGGVRNRSTAAYTFATGYNSCSLGTYAFCSGYGGLATGAVSRAGGDTGWALADGSVAEGHICSAAGYDSQAVGRAVYAVGNYSHVTGQLNSACGEGSEAGGFRTRCGPKVRTFTVSGTTVTIVGDVTADFSNGESVTFFNFTGGSAFTLWRASRTISSVAFGGANTTFTISSGLSDRTGGLCGNTSRAHNSHAEGYASNSNATVAAMGFGSHVEGWSLSTSSRIASGGGSHAEGYSKNSSTQTASGLGSHVEGYASGTGYMTASGKGAHIEGYVKTSNSILASGKGAHAEGTSTTASGNYAHAQGDASTAAFIGQDAQAGGKFATNADSQITQFVMRLATTTGNGTAFVEMVLPEKFDGLTNEKMYACTVTIAGRQDTGANHAMYKRMVIVEQTGTTVALAGAVQTIGTDIETDAAWDVQLTADNTAKGLKIEVKGNTQNIRWVAVVEAIEIAYND